MKLKSKAIDHSQQSTCAAKHFESLLTRCQQIQAEIFLMSGLPKDKLRQAGTEAHLMYEYWCNEYKGPDLPNPYLGFCKMLEDWPTPWPAFEESAVNGLTLVQYFLCYAHDSVEAAISLLQESENDLHSVDLAATQAIWAAMFMTKAKDLAATSNEALVQRKLPLMAT
jgi:hypothetical protein